MSLLPENTGRVVVVDDDRVLRELARDALVGIARVEGCADGASALAALAREPADLVISDLAMQGLSGIELLERVRREHAGTDFVLLTGSASVESAASAVRMGALAYLVKPVRPEALAAVVEGILGRRRLSAENARLRDQIATLEACRALARCLDPGEVHAVGLDVLLSALPCERGLAVFRRSSVPTGDGMAFRGFNEDEARRLRDAITSHKPIEIDGEREPVVVAKGVLHETLAQAGLAARPAMLVPVHGAGSEAGVLCAFEGPALLGPQALERARVVRSHVEIALQNAERYERAKERAFVDDVTEVYNARFLLQATEREIRRAERYDRELTILFLDLDRFKLVNDRHGHLVGSDVLRRLSRVLGECIRQVDTLARYGGDEFTILLVDSGMDEGMAVAERIRRTVAETIFEGVPDVPIRLTISIGVATYPHHGSDRDSLLDAADKAMYRAKSRGRNCCCSADDLDR
jgi:diguanylate cyclase (GGDEF)-like protein